MTDQALRSKPSVAQPIGDVKTFPPRATVRERPMPTNQAEAALVLDDDDYLAYCVRETVHHLYSMIRKRWPDFRPMMR